uniref:Myb_DNA-bind_7 domain-containing protein n=2 Tax=Macrostomum lignano TaxID=282301 RepID=A0A1I8GWI4_9PLAT
DTTQSTDKQQPVSKSLPSSTATAADSVDAVTQPPVNASGKKESEAACAMITLSTSGDQHPATRKPTVPNVTSVDLDDGVDEQLLSDGGEEADDECEEESKSAPTLASGADGRVGGKYGSVMTLFQRKRPVHHQQQHQQQQQQQQQQQHLQNLQQQVASNASLQAKQSAPAIVEEVREDCAELRATYRSFRNVGGRGAATRGRQWSCKETLRFYKAVSTIGTDFSYMASLFKGRSREELKRKYKREEKANPHLIDQMLKKRKHYDLSMFELSSDSDTGADAKSNSGSVSGQKAAKFGSGGGQAAASKPSDIVMEGLKRHLQLKNSAGASSKKQQQQKQVEQQDQTVTVVI